MRRILADAVAFGRQYLRSKVGAFFAFAFPVLLILLFGALFSQTGSTTVDMPVQDLDGTPMSAQFLEILNGTGVANVRMIPTTVDLATYVRDNSLSIALLIPAGFQEDVLAAQAVNGSSPVNVTLYADKSKSTYGIAQGVVGAAIDAMNFQLAGARPILSMASESVLSPTFSFIDFFIPGIVGMTIMTSVMFSMTSVCGEYRTRRYFPLLATTTLKKSEWLVSKILFYIFLMTASLLVSVTAGWLVFGTKVFLTPLAFVFIVVGTVLFTSLGMMIGMFIKDPESGSAVANAIGFPMMFLSGTFWPLESMPDYMRVIAQALPLTYLNNGLRDSMVYFNTGGALFNLAVLTVLAVLFFALPAKLMSWKSR